MKILGAGKVGLFLAAAAAAALAEEPAKIITSFNRVGDASEATFGSFGPKNEAGNVCRESVQPKERVGDQGAAVRLEYDVSAEGAFNGFWIKLGSGASTAFDATGYKNLSFWIKGDAQQGIPYKVKVELKNKSGEPARKYVGGISPDWKKIQIPLDELAEQGLDLGKVSEFVIIFEQKFAAPTTIGAVYIDEVAFEK